MATITLIVREATEGRTIQELEALLSGTAGVERALVDVDDGEVKIEYDESKVRQDQLIDGILQQGFHVSEKLG